MAEYLSILETRRANIESDSVDNDYAQRTSRRYNKINEGRLDKDTLSFMSQFEDDQPAKPTSAPTTKSRPKDAYAGQSISSPTDAQDGNPFTRVFGPMLRESKAKSANIYALSKMYNVAPSEVQKGYSSYVEKTGLATQPTTTEFAKTIGKASMVPLVATAAVANPAAAALAAGGFAAVDEIENFVISKIKDEDYKFLGGKSLSSLLPDEYNQSVKDVVDITEFMGKMYGAARFAPGAAREATKAFDKVTKDIITTYNVPDKVFVNAEKVKSIFQSGENISTQEAELVKSLGLTGPQYRQAIKDGVEIEIPLTKLTKVVDKPYWSKLKQTLGLKPYSEKVEFEMGKPVADSKLKLEGPKGEKGAMYAEEGGRAPGDVSGEAGAIEGAEGGVRLRATEKDQAATLEEIAPEIRDENFKKWFGESKVVDEEGKPLVVYHGTAADFKAFDNAKTGTNDRGLWGRGHYFTAVPRSADSYALRQGEGARIIPAYVSIVNPLVLKTGSDLITRLPDGTNYKELVGENLDGSKIKAIAESGGNDGIIQIKPDGEIGDLVVFSPTKIKSIYNRGSFELENPDILDELTAEPTPDKFKNVAEEATEGNVKPIRVRRMEEPGQIPDASKPQGLYVNREGSETGVEPEMTEQYDYDFLPKNPLDVTNDKALFDHARGGGLLVPPSAGIKALRKLVSKEEMDRLAKLSKTELGVELAKQYPDVEWGRYYDAYEMLEGYAGLLAREKGYDAIIANDELVALGESALAPIKASRSEALGGVKTEELIGQAEERVRMWSEAEAGVEAQASEALSQLGITPTESVLAKPVDITPITGNPRVNIVDFYKPDIEPTVPGEPASALPKYAVNVNLNRIASTDDIRAAIMETSERFKPQMEEVRGPIATHEETKALANDLGMSVESLLNRRKGDPFTPESITASREILSSATKSIIMLRDVASRPDATKIDKLAYRKAIATHAAIQAQVTGLAAEAARSLNAFAINVDPNANPALMAKQLWEAYDRAGGDEITDQMLEDMKFLEYPDQINTYVRNAYKATGMDMLLSLRYFSMLSRPATHVVNVISNAIFSLWQIPERYLAATFGKVLPGDDHMAFAEANQYAFGLIEGVKNGVILAGKALKGEQVSITGKQDFQDTKAITAENVASAFKSVERLNEALPKVGNYLGMGINMLGSLVDVPTRALQVEDAFFKGTASSMYLASESMRVAMSEGLSGTVMAARIEELRSNPTAEMLDAASKYADMLTFTDRADTAIAKGFRTFTRTFPAFKFIMPFQNTPINIFYRSMERTPVLNVLVKSWRSEMSRGGRDRDLALAKLSLGSMLTAAVWSMCDDGSITGGGPSDRKLASTKRLTGWQPYSYKVGDKYHSFNRLDPIASIVGIVADFHEIHGQSQESYKDESDSVAANMVMAMVKNYSSKTYMSGLTNFFEMMSDPERYGQQYIDQFAASFFPGIVASVEKVVDPTVRDVRTSEADSVANPDIMSAMHNEVRSTLNTLRSRIPGYSKDLPPKRNVWGDPIVLTGTFTEEMVSPIYTTSDKKDPASDEVFRLRIPLSTPMRSIRNIDLTPQQYSRYTELAGNAAKDDNDMGFHDNINALIKTREYKDASDELKIEYIKSYQNAFRKLAQNKMIEEYPGLLTKIEASVAARYDSLAE